MTTASQPRRRKKQPFNPAHDRMATDLLRNAKVAPQEVDDPYELGGKIIVMRSIRDDPLARLHDRDHIDQAQYNAGRDFQDDFEAAERGPRAIDPSKEAVDGGLTPEPITERQRLAAMRLAKAHKELGADGSALAHDVLIHGQSLAQVAGKRGMQGRRWEEYFGMRFRECLHCLAKLYGHATEPTGKQRLKVADN